MINDIEKVTGEIIATTFNGFFDKWDKVIAGAKAETLRKARDKGCECPVCGQFVKVYRRLINHAMAVQLATAYIRFGVGTTFHIKDILEGAGGGADFAKLRYWGLIAEIENSNSKKKNKNKAKIEQLLE